MQESKVFFDRLLAFGFWGHDLVSDMLSRFHPLIKRFLLASAFLSLFTFFIPVLAFLRGDFGETAGNLLIGILFLSPLAALFRMRLLLLLMGLRRELGILMGCLAFVHGVGYLVNPNLWRIGQPFFEPGMFFWEKGVVAGMIGLLLTLPLLLTSNNFSVRFLGGRAWKRLHRLAYPAFFFIVFHRFLMGETSESIIPFLEAFLLIGSYLMVKFLAWRPATFPWFQEILVKVGIRYREYRAG